MISIARRQRSAWMCSATLVALLQCSGGVTLRAARVNLDRAEAAPGPGRGCRPPATERETERDHERDGETVFCFLSTDTRLLMVHGTHCIACMCVCTSLKSE